MALPTTKLMVFRKFPVFFEFVNLQKSSREGCTFGANNTIRSKLEAKTEIEIPLLDRQGES